MSRKNTFISSLTLAEKTALEDGLKNGKSAAFRTRCHAILLSYKRYEPKVISDILDVNRSSVYNWFSAWKTEGITGLQTKAGQGRRPKLSIDNAEHVKVVKKAVKKRAQTGANLITIIEQDLAMEGELSMDILRPFLKKLISFGNVSEEA